MRKLALLLVLVVCTPAQADPQVWLHKMRLSDLQNLTLEQMQELGGTYADTPSPLPKFLAAKKPRKGR